MTLRHDPFALIFGQGDEPTRLTCLVLFVLADSPQGNACLVRLLEGQRADGAFPSQLDPKTLGMQETVRHTLLLLKVGMPATGVNVSSAVQFVLQNQNPDGGWCENPALKLPPEQTWLSNEHSITWLTADVVDLLRQTGRGEGPECQAAVKWLRAMQKPGGAWPSLAGEPQVGSVDPDATVQIGFLMGELYGEDDPAYRQARALFEGYLDACAQDAARGYRLRPRDGEREPLDVYTLTHLLLSWPLDPPRRFQRGYDATDSRVRRMMEALMEIQQDDGDWRPFFAEESSPVYTLLAVKVLILSRMLDREDLKAQIEAYAI
jgi:hypothetical protein